MGLDMYLEGELWQWNSTNGGGATRATDKLIKSIRVELGYWRKHHNLHQYIIQEFADNVDNYEDVDLDGDILRKLIEHLEQEPLLRSEQVQEPIYSDEEGEDRAGTLKQLKGALNWLNATDGEYQGWTRTVFYRASW
jgi:hypothetical protein